MRHCRLDTFNVLPLFALYVPDVRVPRLEFNDFTREFNDFTRSIALSYPIAIPVHMPTRVT